MNAVLTFLFSHLFELCHIFKGIAEWIGVADASGVHL
jgi:hypothetical protein